MTRQLIIYVLIKTFILITSGSQGKIIVQFEPPVPKVNENLCIYLNFTDMKNETFHEINLLFKPPTYNQTSIFKSINGSFSLNDQVIEKYFKDRVNKDKTNATNFCLFNVSRDDLAYPFEWTCDDNNISFHLHNTSQDQPPNFNAIFFEPAIPLFGKSICYSLNYSIDSNTLLDNIVLLAKYIYDVDWNEIYHLSENKLQYNNESTFYSKLDTNQTTFNYFCFKNVTIADKLIDFQWNVFDLNKKNMTKKFNNNYNGKLTGYTNINDVKLTRNPPPEKESLCIELVYSLNYNGSINSLPCFNLKINGEVFLYLNDSYFVYNSTFGNQAFTRRVDKSKTTLTHLCLRKIVDTDTSIEFSWYIKDWKNTEAKKIYYLPGFSPGRNTSTMEVYDRRFDLGHQHLCLSVVFSLPNDANVNGISLYSRQPRHSWEMVFEYDSFFEGVIYYENDNIDHDSKRSNGFCFTEVNADVIHRQYQWSIKPSSSLTTLNREFSIKSEIWQIESPQIFQIETIPSVPKPGQNICFFFKIKIDSHTGLDVVSFGTYNITDINYQEIPGSYQEIFHTYEGYPYYNESHPLILYNNIEYERSDYDQICFKSLQTLVGNFKHFKLNIKDFYHQTAEMTYSLPNTNSPDLQHNISAITYNPTVPEVQKPLCITLEFTGQNNTIILSFFASDPGTFSFHLIYSYFYKNSTSYFCDIKTSEICSRIDKNGSDHNKICFKSLTLADSYRNFYWSLEDNFGYLNYPFSFDAFVYPATNPNVTLQSQQSVYEPGDRIVAKCSFENMSVHPKLSWYINNELNQEATDYYSHSNFTTNNTNWYVSVESLLNIEITLDMVDDGKNLMLTCQGEIGYKGARNKKQYQTYESRQLLPIEGAQNDNETIINSVIFSPPVYKRNNALCITLNYSTNADVFRFSLVQSDGMTIKVIYTDEDGRISFPDAVNLTDRIDIEKTNRSSFCLSKVEKIDEREYYWIINDNKKNLVKKPFLLMTYDGPETFILSNCNERNFYVANDFIDGQCVITGIRPEPTLKLYLDDTPFPANWSISSTSPKDDGYVSTSIFLFKISTEMTKKNMSVISCEYSSGEVRNITRMNIYYFKGDNPKKSSNAGVVAGAVIGALLAVALIAGIGYYFYKKRLREPGYQAFVSE